MTVQMPFMLLIHICSMNKKYDTFKIPSHLRQIFGMNLSNKDILFKKINNRKSRGVCTLFHLLHTRLRTDRMEHDLQAYSLVIPATSDIIH